MRVEDLLVESAASIVNLTVRRIAKPDEQDLEQARVGIEAVRALVDLVEGEVAGQIRSALSDLSSSTRGPAGASRSMARRRRAARARCRAAKPSPRASSRRRSSGLRGRDDLARLAKLAAAFRPSACGRLCHAIPPKTRPNQPEDPSLD